MIRRVVLVAVAVGAIAGAGGCAGSRDPRTVEFVVPAGTAARLAAGEKVVVMPDRVELRVGDSLSIRNEDTVDQSVGPFFVGAGNTVRYTYGKPGTFEGYCALSEGQRYEIIVTE